MESERAKPDLRIFGIPIVENEEVASVLGRPGNISLGRLTNSAAARHVFKQATAPRSVATVPAVFETKGR